MGAVVAWAALVLLLLLEFVSACWTAMLTMHGAVMSDQPLQILQKLFTDPSAVVFCATAALAALVFGGVAAITMWRLQAGRLVTALILIPLLLPLPYYLFEHDPMLRFAWPSALGQGIAIGALCGVVRLSGLNPSVLQAAANCGVGPITAYCRLVLSRIAPALLAAALLAVALQVTNLAGRAALGAGPIADFMFPEPERSDVMMHAAVIGGGVALSLTLLTTVALALLRRR
jgi:ABC-type spermidine/putrescine transport system permease subunit II